MIIAKAAGLSYMYKEIELNINFKTLIDTKHYEKIKNFKWYFSRSRKTNTGYAISTTRLDEKTKTIYLHREIYKLEYDLNDEDIKGLQIDHINRDKLDNRIENLRLVNNLENNLNKPKQKNNIVGFKGVYKCNKKDVYKANIHIDGKTKALGEYLTAEEAAIAYNRKALETWGKFAWLNPVNMSLPVNRLSRSNGSINHVFKGYYLNKRSNKWTAHAKTTEGKRIHLGCYNTEDLAKQAYTDYIASIKLIESTKTDTEQLELN